MNYRVLFESCGPYIAGDIVSGEKLGDTAYLLRVGAIEPAEVDAPAPATDAPKTAQKGRRK